MELERLPHGNKIKVVEIYQDNVVCLAKLPNGKWVALNYRSECPSNLPNRGTRASWAFAQGLKVKDVENYVRRLRRERAAAERLDDNEQAIALLKSQGYNVVLKGEIQ